MNRARHTPIRAALLACALTLVASGDRTVTVVDSRTHERTAGVYMVFVESQSQGVGFRQLPHLTLQASAEPAGGTP